MYSGAAHFVITFGEVATIILILPFVPRYVRFCCLAHIYVLHSFHHRVEFWSGHACCVALHIDAEVTSLRCCHSGIRGGLSVIYQRPLPDLGCEVRDPRGVPVCKDKCRRLIDHGSSCVSCGLSKVEQPFEAGYRDKGEAICFRIF